MGRNHFFLTIKKISGVTPNEYIQEMKMIMARYGLEKQLYKSVKDASISVGYKDVRYFSGLFAQRFGALPSTCLEN
ncbi:MAG: AraC family transcriptional regulator [Saprospiraceae bacterium]|jgi:AraC-like DNA-binding protein|nr:AraC family transcriptional regulator [Saprospiraceae bacterium]